MRIEADDLSNPRLLALLAERPLPPPHGAGLDWWTAWEGRQLLGCAALRRGSAGAAEIVLVHTASVWRGRGVGRALLAHLLATARARGAPLVQVRLASDAVSPAAWSLFAAAGFEPVSAEGDTLVFRPGVKL